MAGCRRNARVLQRLADLSVDEPSSAKVHEARRRLQSPADLLMDPLIDRQQLRQILKAARDEDLGPFGDITSRLLPETVSASTGVWQLVARQPGRFCGGAILPDLLAELAPEVTLDWLKPHADACDVAAGQP